MVTDPKGVLSRIDPASNKVVAEIAGGAGFGGVCVWRWGAVWVSSPEKERGDARRPQDEYGYGHDSGGGRDRDLFTAGRGGDLDAESRRRDGVASGCESRARWRRISKWGSRAPAANWHSANGHVWATVFQIPLFGDSIRRRIRWCGSGWEAGGDSVRIGHGSVWLSNLLREQKRVAGLILKGPLAVQIPGGPGRI